MSEIFGISFDILSCPNLRIKHPGENNPTNNSGWGIAWYPNDDYSASVVKDISNASAKNFSRLLSSWNNFNSTMFLFKLTGQDQAYTQHNTQPFNKSYGGRDWIFCHRGQIDKNELSKTLHLDDGIFEPLGTTDSELIFCHLLSKLHDSKAKSIGDINFETLHLWLKIINQFGASDVVLSEGQSMAIYRDLNSNDDIYYKRHLPPHTDTLFESEMVQLNIDTKIASNCTGLVFSSTKPVDDNDWQVMKPGQLLILRKGAIVWDSIDLVINIPEQMNEEKAVSIVNQDMSIHSQIQPQSSNQLSTVITDQASNASEGRAKNYFTLNVKATLTSEDGALLKYKTYSIVHETEYTYEQPVDRSKHLLRLQPIDDQVQELVQSTLELSADCEKVLFEDVFGNHAIHLNIFKPYQQLILRSTSVVKIYQTALDDYSLSIRRSSIPLVWMPWQRQMMSPYLLPPELPETQLQELSDYAMSFVERNDYNLFDTLADINKSIHKDYSYESGSTTLKTTAYDVFVNRKGVCQDFSNLLICLARLLSIPARYRVGYIYTGTDYENSQQGDATHAWAEVYLPYVGWRGFDPTNGCLVAQDHIRVACGRHYRDATPTSGTIYSKNNPEHLKVNVTVDEISL